MTWSPPSTLGPVAVAIPARDEEGYIQACLRALDHQIGAQADHIILCINNTVDQTAEIAR
jgi:glycosyltransferase involved in cell wall biosynthesis